MEATIINFRRNSTGQTMNQLVVKVAGIDSADNAKKLIGKKATINTGKKEIVGKISGLLGNSGTVRVLFQKGIPGQMLGTKLNIE